MPHATHGNVRIWYEEHGSGFPVVLLQGLGLSSRFWHSTPEVLGRRFRVILIDNRGTGRSDRPLRPYRIPLMARDALAALDELGLERFAVAGISMGGMIAQELALAVPPERLAGLALIATTCGLPYGKSPPLRSLARLMRVARRTPENVRRVREILASKPALQANPDLFADFDALWRANPTPSRVFLGHLLAVSLHSTGKRLHRIHCPTLVLTGGADQLVVPENSRILARLIPGARLEVVPGAGHVLPLEQRELFQRLLIDFLTELPDVREEPGPGESKPSLQSADLG